MFIFLPEMVPHMIKDLDALQAWVKRHGFFGLSGIALWIYLLVKAIIWLFVHVRFV